MRRSRTACAIRIADLLPILESCSCNFATIQNRETYTNPLACRCRRHYAQYRSVAQIGAPHGVVLLDCIGAAREHHASGFEEIGAMREIERHRRVLLDEQDADLL